MKRTNNKIQGFIFLFAVALASAWTPWTPSIGANDSSDRKEPFRIESVRSFLGPILLRTDGLATVSPVLSFKILPPEGEDYLMLSALSFSLTGSENIAGAELRVDHLTVATIKTVEGVNRFTMGDDFAAVGGNGGDVSLFLIPSEKADIDATVTVKPISLTTFGIQLHPLDLPASTVPFGILVRDNGQDGIAFHRIPGMIRTNRGTLLAVYDMRRSCEYDLPGDIDIGLSRSVDGGRSWEPIRTAMNITGPDETRCGVGDPAILYDPATERAWVAAIHLPDRHKPLPSGKFGGLMLTFSDDDGLTWSPPRSITEEIAGDKEWVNVLQGPGAGIVYSDGTLVFPAQASGKGGGSTVMTSSDHGQTWRIGTVARPMTTESQVVELEDGSLLLTMRNETRSGARAVAVTDDMGETWTPHSTDNKTLADPVCQASILRIASKKGGDDRNVIAFCNPNSAKERVDMTLKLSLDEGVTWPVSLLLNPTRCFGYSSMALIDPETLGVLYESKGGLIFQRIKWPTLLKEK